MDLEKVKEEYDNILQSPQVDGAKGDPQQESNNQAEIGQNPTPNKVPVSHEEKESGQNDIKDSSPNENLHGRFL